VLIWTSAKLTWALCDGLQRPSLDKEISLFWLCELALVRKILFALLSLVPISTDYRGCPFSAYGT
jgi:hypothetical protein